MFLLGEKIYLGKISEMESMWTQSRQNNTSLGKTEISISHSQVKL